MWAGGLRTRFLSQPKQDARVIRKERERDVAKHLQALRRCVGTGRNACATEKRKAARAGRMPARQEKRRLRLIAQVPTAASGIARTTEMRASS